MPSKPKELNGCPFRVGDVVKRKATSCHKIPPLVVTKTMLIPDINRGGYTADVKVIPYWIYGEEFNGQVWSSKKEQGDPHAIWVGFMELDPFLGMAKRAVMEHGESNA